MKITKFKVNGEDALVSESALEGQLLPPPSAEDAGKAVVVSENGKYELAEAGGGPYIVHRVFEDGGITRLDKTWNEIKTALATNVVLHPISSGLRTKIGIVYDAFQDYVEEKDGSTSIFYKVLIAQLPQDTQTWIANGENSYPVLDR